MRVRRIFRQRGQGLVEFAVIFPIFAFLLFGVIDGGLVMGRYNGVNHAATVGARFGAVQSEDDPANAAAAVFAQVKEYAPGTSDDYVRSCDFSANDDAVCVQWLVGPEGEAPGDIGSSIRVAVKHHYSGLTPLIKSLGGWDVTACMVERQEQVVAIDPADDTFIGDSGNCTGAGVPTASPTPSPTHPQQTATAAVGATATAAAGQTATAVAGQTATAVAGQTATAVAGQTATAVAGQTATAVAGQTSTAVAGQTATAVAGRTATAAAGRTATSVAKTATAMAPTNTPVPTNTPTPTNSQRTATARAGRTATSVAQTATALAATPAPTATPCPWWWWWCD